jgi:hypothetical protein
MTQYKHYILLCFLGFSNLCRLPPILCEVALSIFSGFTGYVWQEDDLYSGREALIVHFLGGRSILATLLSIPSESGEYLISFFLLFHFYILYLNIGDNVHPKCKGRVKWWYHIGYTFAWVCLFDGRYVIKLWEILVSAILAPNLNFFTTFRSEALALASVSWIGVILLAHNRTIQKNFPPKNVRFAFRFDRKSIYY